MSGHRAVAAVIALLIVTAGGCSGTSGADRGQHPVASTPPGRVSTSPAAAVVQRSEHEPWQTRIVLPELSTESAASQVVDPPAAAYFLVSKTNTPVQGPWMLSRVSLSSGAVRLGPTFPVGGLTLSSGYLWVYGTRRPGSPPVVTEVSPLTLQRIRQIPLPAVPASFGGTPVALTAGPAGSLWIGSYRTMLRVSVASGTTLATTTLPAGLAVSNISVDPAGKTLYVSAVHVVSGGGVEGLVMLEYNADTGRELATASGGLIADSVAGATLAAVPAGVWASFRTGMLGVTIHLGASGLGLVPPPGPRINLAPAGVFHWPMYETTAYGGGALWVTNQVGIVACLDPRTGKIRASEHVSQSQLIYRFEAIDPAARAIFAVQNGDLVQIRPPRQCW